MEFKVGDQVIVKNWAGIIDDFHGKIGKVIDIKSRPSGNYSLILFPIVIGDRDIWWIEKKYLQLHQSKFHKYVI